MNIFLWICRFIRQIQLYETINAVLLLEVLIKFNAFIGLQNCGNSSKYVIWIYLRKLRLVLITAEETEYTFEEDIQGKRIAHSITAHVPLPAERRQTNFVQTYQILHLFLQ